MQEAIDQGWPDAILLTNDPVMDFMRKDPRYRTMEAGVIRHIEQERQRLGRATDNTTPPDA